MRIMVALENRLVKTRNGNIYSTTVCDYNFWSRYLLVFDEVVVLARVGDIDQKELDKPCANGLGVRFFRLPYYIGPWQYLKQRRKIKTIVEKAICQADVFSLRIPGRVSTLLWYELMRQGKPYGVEVVGSSADVAQTCGCNALIRFVLGILGPRNQRRQCKDAIAASYITREYLQSLYPPGGWHINCSNVDLPDEVIIDGHQLDVKLASTREAIHGGRPFRICHVGSMAAKYKGQDVLIEAIWICRDKGIDVELMLLGDGQYRPCFEKKAAKLGVSEHIHFLGFLQPSGVREQLDRADMFIFPSFTEGQGKALIEAMGRGLPCIGSNIGGIPELLEVEDLVPAGNAEALAEKIGETICDENRLLNMSKRNLQTARQYRKAELSKRRIAYYKKLVELSRGN